MSDLMDIVDLLIKFFQAQKLYIFLGLGLFVLVMGIVLTLVLRNTAKAEKNQKETADNQAKLRNLQDLHNIGDERGIPDELLTKVDRLMEIGEQIKDLLVRIESKQPTVLGNCSEESPLTLDERIYQAEESPQTLDERIYQAYENGLGVPELAIEFGRPKGEVELILNLYRSKIRKEG